MEIRVLHEALVDKQELLVVALAGKGRFGDIAVDAHQRGVYIDGNQLCLKSLAHQCRDALQEGARLQFVHQVPIVHQGELNVMVDHGELLKLPYDVVQFHLVAFEELASCRDVIEDVLDHEVAAWRTHVGFLALAHRTVDDELSSQLCVVGACAQLHLRDGGNRGQRLAAEPHGGEREQVIGAANLGGAVPLEGQARVGVGHAHAIVNNLYQCPSGILEDNLDVVGTGINGVLHQLLDDRGRALDYLASSNLVGNRIGQ